MTNATLHHIAGTPQSGLFCLGGIYSDITNRHYQYLVRFAGEPSPVPPLPASFGLLNVYPNPFNATSQIRFPAA